MGDAVKVEDVMGRLNGPVELTPWQRRLAREILEAIERGDGVRFETRER